MISIIICKNDDNKRQDLERVISNHIIMEQLSMKIVLSTANPDDVIYHLDTNPGAKAVYILGMNLRHHLNGISLARKIRERDVNGRIIFLTVHAELAFLPYTYKVEALDFIIEDDADITNKKVKDSIIIAYERMVDNWKTKAQYFTINLEGQTQLIPVGDIMFFESGIDPRTAIVHLPDEQIEFRSSLKEIVEKNHSFHRCHQSFVVNIVNIKSIDKKNRVIHMKNGQTCYISTKGLKELENHEIFQKE